MNGFPLELFDFLRAFPTQPHAKSIEGKNNKMNTKRFR
jgi:hypothetical protein